MDEILKAREDRYYRTLYFIEKYQLPVIVGKINYPGNNKNTSEALMAFQVLQQLLISRYKKHRVFTELLFGEDGGSILMVVDMTPLEAKKVALDLEEKHPLGRVFDIDVYKEDGTSVGREGIGLKSRRCFLCNEDARLCIRSKKHPLQEIIDSVNKLIYEYCV